MNGDAALGRTDFVGDGSRRQPAFVVAFSQELAVLVWLFAWYFVFGEPVGHG